jgi:hypothetical protein
VLLFAKQTNPNQSKGGQRHSDTSPFKVRILAGNTKGGRGSTQVGTYPCRKFGTKVEVTERIIYGHREHCCIGPENTNIRLPKHFQKYFFHPIHFSIQCPAKHMIFASKKIYSMKQSIVIYSVSNLYSGRFSLKSFDQWPVF